MAEAVATSWTDEAPLSEDSTFQALLRTIRRADRFTLIIAVCNNPARQQKLIERLSASLTQPVSLVELDADVDVFDSVVSEHQENSACAIMVTGLASGIRSVDPESQRLRALNHKREEWPSHITVPIVFWIPEYLLQPLAMQAPDFLDWRSGTFLFLDPLVSMTSFDSRVLGRESLYGPYTELERRQRISQLNEWISSLPDQSGGSSDPAKKRWRRELAQNHFFLGEWDESLAIARRELQEIPEDDLESRAFAWSMIAEVLERRGELNEALRIRREEELPVYERLDVWAKAVTMGKIADVLQAQGELDEALRIRREEELPVFERLGDVRAKAMTMGKISDVLEARGDLNEALRILGEELIPVFERLGDVRSRAVTMGKIADVLVARGELDEGLRIYREEVLLVFERLGDVRAKAVTMGQIADVLVVRGELDEVLRIRREEELPVFERLGDVRAKAVTMGKIADVLAARGELDEALRIRREEELPVYEKTTKREALVVRGKIADLEANNNLDRLENTIKTFKTELIPQAQQLGDRQLLVWFRRQLATHYLRQPSKMNAGRVLELLNMALMDAVDMKLSRESQQLRELIVAVKRHRNR